MFSELVNKFNTDGYAVIEDFLTEEEVELLRKEAENLIKDMPDKSKRTVFTTTDSESKQNKDKYFIDSGDKISYFFESGALSPDGELLVEPHLSLNKIGHALHELNEVFRKITLDVRVKETCFQLNFVDPVIPQSMYIFKNPGIGSEVVPHQDATYLYTEPVNLVGLWIALEDSTIENGCLRFIRGSHKSGVHRRYIRNPDKNSDELIIYNSPPPIYQKSAFVPVPVFKGNCGIKSRIYLFSGSCVLIHGQVVHYSEANKSDRSRHAYTFHVIENNNTKYSEENWLQPPKEGQFLSLYNN